MSPEEAGKHLKHTQQTVVFGSQPSEKRASSKVAKKSRRRQAGAWALRIMYVAVIGVMSGHALVAIEHHRWGDSGRIERAVGPSPMVVTLDRESPWMKAIFGGHADGGVVSMKNAVEWAKQYMKSGHSAEQTRQLLHQAALSSTVSIFGRTQPELAKQASEHLYEEQILMALVWKNRNNSQKVASLLSEARQAGTDTRTPGVFDNRQAHSGRHVATTQRIGAPKAKTAIEAVFYSGLVDIMGILEMSSQRSKHNQAGNAPDLHQARKDLVRAVRNTGLAGWKVNAMRWNNATALEKDAKRLEAANRELQQVTGWKGGVLGLHQRVLIDANHFGDGTTAISSDGKHILIQGDWAALSHEWFHALDRTLGKSLINITNDRVLSSMPGTGLKKPVFANHRLGPLVVARPWRDAYRLERFLGQVGEGIACWHCTADAPVFQAAERRLWENLAYPSWSLHSRHRLIAEWNRHVVGMDSLEGGADGAKVAQGETKPLSITITLGNTRNNKPARDDKPKNTQRVTTSEKVNSSNAKEVKPTKEFSGEGLIFSVSAKTWENRTATWFEKRKNFNEGENRIVSVFFKQRAAIGNALRKSVNSDGVFLDPSYGGMSWTKKDLLDYPTEPAEMLAYAFDAYAQLLWSKDDTKTVLLNPQIAHGYDKFAWNMGRAEAKADRGTWQDFFKTLAPWWRQDAKLRDPWSGKPAVDAPEVAKQSNLRRTSEATASLTPLKHEGVGARRPGIRKNLP